MAHYARKFYYQDKAVAESYFQKRFTRPKGVREHKALRRAMERALEAIPGARKVLDLPCGTGRFANFFWEKGYDYFGVDISKEMLDVLAKEQTHQKRAVSLTRCDGEFLAFKDNAFDCVVCVRLFNLIPRSAKVAVLGEIRRVSNKWLIVEVRHVKSMGRLAGMKFLLKKFFGNGSSASDLDPDIVNSGWNECRWVRVKGTHHWVGVFQKNQ